MCKVAAIAGITDKNRGDVWVFAQILGQSMSLGNSDGLGYAAFDKDGKLFGERWLFNDTAFGDLTQIKGLDSQKMGKIYSHFGKVDKDSAQGIVLHTRAATCEKGIVNTHPFVDSLEAPTVAIIHNGMIYNEEKFPRTYSTCDSEVLAPLYADHLVGHDLKNLNKFTPELEGWYTVLALAKDQDDKMIMDAFTDSGRLGSFYIKELETRVWSTYAVDVQQVAKSLGLTAIDEMKMDRDTAIRIDVLTGDIVDDIKLETSGTINVRVLPNMWEGWQNVEVMEGNLDDEEFRNRWFKKVLPGYRGD